MIKTLFPLLLSSNPGEHHHVAGPGTVQVDKVIKTRSIYQTLRGKGLMSALLHMNCQIMKFRLPQASGFRTIMHHSAIIHTRSYFISDHVNSNPCVKNMLKALSKVTKDSRNQNSIMRSTTLSSQTHVMSKL